MAYRPATLEQVGIEFSPCITDELPLHLDRVGSARRSLYVPFFVFIHVRDKGNVAEV